MSRIIMYRCEGCGILIKIYISTLKCHFSILDKLYSEKQLLDSNDYLKCIDCNHVNSLQIQKVYL